MNTLKYPPVGISGRKRAGKNTVADPLRAVLLAIEETMGRSVPRSATYLQSPSHTSSSSQASPGFCVHGPGVRRHADA